MKKNIVFLLIFWLPFQLVLAQVDTNDFNIRVSVVDDSTPPSTPVLLSVLPVAPTQIDLSWSSSTDNYLVSGYSILRDGSPIATTTLTSYSDTSLVASTTYSYSVRAFDIALNYSSSSNSLSTTTPNYSTSVEPVTPEVDNSSAVESTSARVVLRDLQIVPGVSTTSIRATTALPARLEIRWGRSASYELGYIIYDAYSKVHNVFLTDLEPGTTYEYQIIGYTPAGYHSVVKAGQFITHDKKSVLPPINVSKFLASTEGSSVRLSWQLPEQTDFSHVRIVRSHLGFPAHPQDGAVVYHGSGYSVVDKDILNRYSPIYYTAFAYDIYGNVSSGAVAIVFADTLEIMEDGYSVDRYNQIGNTLPGEKATTSIMVERVTPDMKIPEIGQIFVEQDSNVFSLTESNITLLNNQAFRISIAKEAIAGNLKSIIVTLLDPTDNRQQYSFLLRINKDQSAYEAVVSSFGTVGKSRLIIEIYDYEAAVVARYQGPILFVEPLIKNSEVLFPDILFKSIKVTIFYSGLFLFCIVLSIIYLLYWRQGEDKG